MVQRKVRWKDISGVNYSLLVLSVWLKTLLETSSDSWCWLLKKTCWIFKSTKPISLVFMTQIKQNFITLWHTWGTGSRPGEAAEKSWLSNNVSRTTFSIKPSNDVPGFSQRHRPLRVCRVSLYEVLIRSVSPVSCKLPLLRYEAVSPFDRVRGPSLP